MMLYLYGIIGVAKSHSAANLVPWQDILVNMLSEVSFRNAGKQLHRDMDSESSFYLADRCAPLNFHH
jgi:hypothetical protein